MYMSWGVSKYEIYVMYYMQNVGPREDEKVTERHGETENEKDRE